MPGTILEESSLAPPDRTGTVYRVTAKLILEKGFGGTPIGDIAKAVGSEKLNLPEVR